MADSLVQRADWNFMRNLNPGVMMGWKPSFGFLGFGRETRAELATRLGVPVLAASLLVARLVAELVGA